MIELAKFDRSIFLVHAGSVSDRTINPLEALRFASRLKEIYGERGEFAWNRTSSEERAKIVHSFVSRDKEAIWSWIDDIEKRHEAIECLFPQNYLNLTTRPT